MDYRIMDEKYQTIATKIIGLKNADIKLRDKLIQDGKLGNGYNQEMEKLHNDNAEILSEIIDKIGYPTIDKVGEEAYEASWLIIQHSISKPNFMRKCVKLLENAGTEDSLDKIKLAYLSDRIAVFEGRPQCYGTQFDWDENGKLSAQHFDDLIKVNERRISIGLNTLEEQTKIIRNRAKEENETPPPDLERRKEELEKWKRSVGWII